MTDDDVISQTTRLLLSGTVWFLVKFFDVLHDDLFLVEHIITLGRCRILAAIKIDIIMKHNVLVATLAFVFSQLWSCTLPPEVTAKNAHSLAYSSMRKMNINPDNSPARLIGQHNLSHRIRQQEELAERVGSNTQLNIILEWIFFRLCCILRIYATNYKNGEEN